MEAVAGEAVTRLSDFNPQELSNILVAYARTNYLKVQLLEVRTTHHGRGVQPLQRRRAIYLGVLWHGTFPGSLRACHAAMVLPEAFSVAGGVQTALSWWPC